MKYALIIGAAAAAFAGGAQAAELVLDGVVGRVEVITENRGDIAVSVVPSSPRASRRSSSASVMARSPSKARRSHGKQKPPPDRSGGGSCWLQV